MDKLTYSIIALISIGAGTAGFHFINQVKKLPPPEYALYYQQARPIAAFSLTDELGQSFNNKNLQGKWSLVFLGYTSCPDVCPTTLQNLNFIFNDLSSIAKNSQVLLVSVDPKRDSQEKLAQYVTYFNSDFKALRAEHHLLFPFVRNLGLMYAITSKEGEEDGYWVDHSASLVLINPSGSISAIFKPEQVAGEFPSLNNEKLMSDYQKIVALYKD